jgi:hypothetical protein
MYLKDKPLQYLLDSVNPNQGGKTTTGNVSTATVRSTTVNTIDPKKAFSIAKKSTEIGKQMVENKPKDPTVYNISTREKDIVAFDPKKIVTDSIAKKESSEIISGIPNTYLYIGSGIIGLSIIYMLMRD